MSASSEVVSCKQEDHLDTDPPLRGQNYVCLSFLSPEDVLKTKDAFFFGKFLASFTKDMSEFFDNMQTKYPEDKNILQSIKDRYSYVFDTKAMDDEYKFFVRMNSEPLEKEFHEANNFRTSVRGLKVRGVFDSRREAEIRAQVLKKLDDKFHVYVGEVGCWLPWHPNPDDITDVEFAESELNTLMKKYKENQLKKDIFFQERLKESALEDVRKKLDAVDPVMQAKEQSACEQSANEQSASATEVSTEASSSS